MKASFIIGFHTARKDNLLQLLRFMDSWHQKTISNCELITVCQDKINFEIDSKNWKFHNHFNMNLQEMNLPLITNFAVKKSQCEKIIVLESDRILPKEYFESTIEELKKGIQITTLKMNKLIRPHEDSEIEENTLEFICDDRSESNELGCKNMWSGNTAFMKEDFFNCGMMDEDYIGYGWADNDMCMKMQKTGIKSIFKHDTEIHLWHPKQTYGVEDQKKMFLNNGIRFCKKWDKPFPDIIRKEILNYRRTII